MIRLIELSPAAGDALEQQLKQEHEPEIVYRRVGTRFTFPQGDMPDKMRRLSRNLDFVLAKYGQSHMIEDQYV